MKKLVLCLLLTGCEGCDAPYDQKTGYTSKTSIYTQVEGCVVYNVQPENHSNFLLAKCNGLTATSQRVNKAQQNVINIEPRVPETQVEDQTSDDIAKAAANVALKMHRSKSDEDRILELAEDIKEHRAVLDKLNEHDREILGIKSEPIHND